MSFQTETAIKSLLQAEIGACKIIPVSGGGSSAKLYSVTSSERENYYLKISNTRNTTDRLEDDAIIYAWLSGKIEVPKVVFYKKKDHLEALCITAIEGKTLKDWMGILSPEEIISIYAKTLKDLHAIPIENCPIQRNIDLFYEAYGLEQPNQEKIDYYIMLDEFF